MHLAGRGLLNSDVLRCSVLFDSNNKKAILHTAHKQAPHIPRRANTHTPAKRDFLTFLPRHYKAGGRAGGRAGEPAG